MNYYADFYPVTCRRADAVAFVKGSDRYKDIKGRVLFYGVNGGVIVHAEMTGLPKGSGSCDSPIFALHIHGGSQCTGNENDAFADVGAHYNPKDCPHPYHAGDLPPLFGADGNAFSAFLTNRFSVQEVLGKTIIVHGSADDFKTQPSGDAGEKIACGVIMPTAR